MPKNNIFIVENKDEEKFLRKKAIPFDFEKWKKSEIAELIRGMRKTMREADGIGLSANQIGESFRMFVAEVPGEAGKKFYALFNPTIEKTIGEKILLEEGCLSVPGSYGAVPRYEEVVLRGQDKNGKSVKIKAWGLLAHVFQHETDHLDGKLFIDKAEEVRNGPRSDRLKKRESRTNSAKKE